VRPRISGLLAALDSLKAVASVGSFTSLLVSWRLDPMWLAFSAQDGRSRSPCGSCRSSGLLS
jgi:hypothetical protein